MKILVTPNSMCGDNPPEALNRLREYADEVILNPYGRPLQPEELAKILPGVDGYLAGLDFVDETALSGADKLRAISRYGVGYDRVDLAAAKAKGIPVSNTPGANADAVADLAFALMLAVARRIPKLDRATRAGQWPHSSGREMPGKTLGILGLGAIGRKLAQRAQGFDMTVIAYDPFMDENYAKAHNISVCSQEEVIVYSDVISLHLPMNEQTKYIINAETIAKMKDEAILINTARGGLIDEKAALEALESGKLFGMGLDAYEQEPPEKSPLFERDDVVLTPHTGAHTKETTQRMANMAIDNLLAMLEGKDCGCVLNR